MDYCHPCRRHLNGALACAGCGTPAEGTGPLPRCPRRRPRATRRMLRADGRQRPRPPPGRAGVRRGSHRRRGRTVLLAVGGLVLAAGALSLAELAMEPGRDDTAADFVEDATARPRRRPSRTPSPASRRRIRARSRPAGADPWTRRRRAARRRPTRRSHRTPAPRPRPRPRRTPEPGEATTTPASPPDASDSPTADPSGPVEPEDPQEPPTVPAPPPPPGDPTEDPAPTPSPTPSPTCTRFLWWCT